MKHLAESASELFRTHVHRLSDDLTIKMIQRELNFHPILAFKNYLQVGTAATRFEYMADWLICQRSIGAVNPVALVLSAGVE